MTVTTMDISTRRGTNLPLDSRRRDALATYARLAAEDEGVAPQAWVRKTWGFKDYQAKDLLKGNSSEALWEQILKSKHPRHGGWQVGLSVLGAVIGHPVHEHFRREIRNAAREQEQLEQHARLAEAARSRLSLADALRPGWPGIAAGEDRTRGKGRRRA